MMRFDIGRGQGFDRFDRADGRIEVGVRGVEQIVAEQRHGIFGAVVLLPQAR